MTFRSRYAGITLIELMLVMVIVAILSAIAIPGYRNYVIRAHRAEAKSATLAMAGQLERCFTRFNRYDAAGCGVDISDVPSTPDGRYMLNVVRDAATFTITAAPQGGQADDDQCGSFTLTSENQRGIVGGSGTAATCWSR